MNAPALKRLAALQHVITSNHLYSFATTEVPRKNVWFRCPKLFAKRDLIYVKREILKKNGGKVLHSLQQQPALLCEGVGRRDQVLGVTR